MPHHRLAIHPTPFKPSHLSIPPSPFSPLSPLTPIAKPQSQTAPSPAHTKASPTKTLPTTPLQWVWTCHACHSAYPLGATRRCLDDGHHFCAGTTIVKRWRTDSPKRRVKRHKACASEFDYLGWKGWGRWKRSGLPPRPARAGIADEGLKKDCWSHCDYPSQCRWGKRVGIHTPSPTPTRTTFSFDSGIDTAMLNTPIELPTLDDCFAASPTRFDPESRESVGALGRALEASAKRRKSLGSTSPTSPLKMEFSPANTAFDGDAYMTDVEDPEAASWSSSGVDERCIDPALLAISDVDTSYTSSTSTAMPIDEWKTDEKSNALDRLKNLLSLSSPRPSRRHIELLPVTTAQRKLRRRHAMTGLSMPEPSVRTQEPMMEGLVPLEEVRMWNESALNVV